MPTMRFKIAGCPIVDSIKEPQCVGGLHVKHAFWDLPCLDCGLPMLRFLHSQFLIMHRCPAQCRCKNCESVHIVELVKKGKSTFQVLIQRDYTDQTMTEGSRLFQFEPTQVFQT